MLINAAFGDTRAVNQQIDAPENLVYAAGKRQRSAFAGGVGAKPYAIPSPKSALISGRHSRIALNINDRHAVSFFCKPTAKEDAQGLASANDNGEAFMFFSLSDKRQNTARRDIVRYRPQRVRGAGEIPRRPSKRK